MRKLRGGVVLVVGVTRLWVDVFDGDKSKLWTVEDTVLLGGFGE